MRDPPASPEELGDPLAPEPLPPESTDLHQLRDLALATRNRHAALLAFRHDLLAQTGGRIPIARLHPTLDERIAEVERRITLLEDRIEELGR